MQVHRFCCFVCATADKDLKLVTDQCPSCGAPFDFPLTHAPKAVRSYEVVAAKSRGFYGATFQAVAGNLRRPVIVKLIPRSIYRNWPDKNFENESRLHAEVAAESEHLVKIEDFFDEDVDFQGQVIPCHVQILDFVAGPTLDDFLTSDGCGPREAAQIAMDLFDLLGELERREAFHNDLHAANLIVHPLVAGRAQAVAPGIRIVAIDLNSLGDRSKSDNEQRRLGDLAWVANHFGSLVDRLLRDPDRLGGNDYRLTTALEELAISLKADPTHMRTPSYDELSRAIRHAFEFVNSPWQAPAPLQTFDDSYNAQSLHPAWIPELLVDPAGSWTRKIAQPGPLIIHGMRGCGKTMLTRALQFHARVYHHQQTFLGRDGNGDPRAAIAAGLASDGYLGLYVSCNKLLDSLADADQPLHEPYARLFLAYAREALRAIRHLRVIDQERVVPDWEPRVGQVIAEHICEADDLAAIGTELELEHRLQLMLISLDRGETRNSLSVHPSIAFGNLAEAIRASADIWRNAPVYYLLDDVSTRHLKQASVTELLSQLLFKDPGCAFKITTETQTLETLLKTPGANPAWVGRDYVSFDLGGAVNERLRRRTDGRDFISQVLKRRARHYDRHPAMDPIDMLGDTPLQSIAKAAASTRKTAAERKSIYHGISALTAVCVGDIGDVIHIYELMLRRADDTPISPEIQSAAYQAYCNQRLFQLNRRDSRLKDFALTFAQASYELLAASYAPKRRAGANKGGSDGEQPSSRLRQYTSLHLNITTGDIGKRIEDVRELVDAGIFVFKGGGDSPRMKTRDSNPIQQFTLTYRKLFGLSNFIGLAERDRFELSGADLEEWLDHPERGKTILTRNLGGDEQFADLEEEAVADEPTIPSTTSRARSKTHRRGQAQLWPDTHEPTRPSVDRGSQGPVILPRMPAVREIGLADIGAVAHVVAGLGFEDRALMSCDRVTHALPPAEAVLLEYHEPGHGAEIEEMLAKRGWSFSRRPYIAGRYFQIGDAVAGSVLIDVSGLAKPVIFSVIRDVLYRTGRVYVAHTGAKRYYPLDEEIAPILAAESGEDPFTLLQDLESVWPGESGGYTFDRLLDSVADDSRARVLIASVSPKHQRLLSLVEERDYEQAELLVPAGDSPRSRLARIAADVVAQLVPESSLHPLDSNDLSGSINFVLDRYQKWYVEDGYEVELGLTGSKLQTVAFATAAAGRKMSQAWYVRPDGFDTARFTTGTGDTRVFEIVLRPDEERTMRP